MRKARADMSSRPHILFAVTVPVSWNFYRGMLRYLANAGLSVTMVSAPGKSLDEIGTAESAASVGVPMEREISPLRDLASLGRLYRVMKAARPQIVDASTPKAGLLGMLAAMLAGVPCRIYTVRGLRMETATGLKRLVLLGTERVACWCAHRVLPVSESLRQRVIELKLVNPEKTYSLGTGDCSVDLDRFTPRLRNSEQVSRLRQDLGLTGNERVVGFVGRFVKDKGIGELVDAFRELSASDSGLRLLLVGDFEDGDPVAPQVRRYLETTPTVLRTGFVDDTAPYYALMDVLVLPTYREGFPCVPLEAQASEIPVITTNATGAVDSVQDGVTGLIVPPKDARALADAIHTLLRNPDIRAEMGRAGREWISRHFRPELIWKAHAEMYREMLEEYSQRERQSGPSLAVKRVFDLFVATTTLFLFSPLLIAIALVVRIFLGSPVLFRQVRPGYAARPFTCLKFRTMTDECNANGQLLPDAQRLTALGRFLRASSLDELPELINVLRGEMSLVGPRPLLMQYVDRYTPEQTRRHDVMPGITGWAQVNGRNAASWDQKFAYDVWYVENRSFFLDLKILILTVWKTLKREGISNGKHATMPEFMGCEKQTTGQVS